MTRHRGTIAVDFDGTIAKYEGWLGESQVGDALEGAVDFIKRLKAAGWRVEIYSARGGTREGFQAIHGWLKRYEIDHLVDRITNVKGYHHVAFVDDRAIFCNGKNYDEVLALLEVTYGA